VADTRSAPMVPVEFNGDSIAEDLTHHPPVARKALDLFGAKSIAMAGCLSHVSSVVMRKDATAPASLAV
jgi:hypothetical protein